MSHATISLEMSAEIGDFKLDREIVQFAGQFGVNQIPTGSLWLNVGKDPDRVAVTHQLADKFFRRLPCKVYLTPTVHEADGLLPGVPTGKKILVWDGDAVGVGWRRGTSSAVYTVHLLHWLASLDYASAVSATSHPGNPFDWTFPAATRPQANAQQAALGAGRTAAGWIPVVGSGMIEIDTFDDLWGNALHKWLTSVAQNDPIDRRLLGGAPGRPNTSAIAALSRMRPGNPAGIPLQLDIDPADRTAILEDMRVALLQETGGNWVNTTLWGKLIGEWAPSYWFMVVPRVSDALIVPMTAGLRDHWATIHTTSYDQSEVNSQTNRLLRAVGIAHPVAFQTGFNGEPAAGVGAGLSGMCGFYQPSTVTDGVVLIKEAPRWLSSPLHAHIFSPSATGAIGGLITSVLDGRPAPFANPAESVAGLLENRKRTMNRFAQQWYVVEALKNKVGEVSGKLRFDICPGSAVKVVMGRATNVAADVDGLTKNHYGMVNSVSYLVNAESRKVATTFSLAHVRNQKENDTEGMTIDRPPLYAKAWRGAAMVGTPLITPET